MKPTSIEKWLAVALVISLLGCVLFAMRARHAISCYNQCRKRGIAPDICLTESCDDGGGK